jgi:pimeloyl-ACP methyl ester carboxylesterase
MSINTDNQIKLSDGCSLGYGEYGDPQGKPVLHFHGLPSSRLEGHRPALDEIATRLGAHIIVVDRPGIGLSDFKPYTIAGWPDIVVELADKLDLDRFAVMGFSSGGKYVAACAWKIPQRLTAAGIISGPCPFDLPGAKDALSKQDRQLYWLADKMPWLFRLMLWKIARDARRNPSTIFSLFTEISEPDKAALARPDIKQVFEEMVVEAFRQGTRGAALDWMLEARPWGFSLQDIRMPVCIWHGESDKLLSAEQGRILAKAIPNARVKFYPDEGHTLIVNRYEELLSTLVQHQTSSSVMNEPKCSNSSPS